MHSKMSSNSIPIDVAEVTVFSHDEIDDLFDTLNYQGTLEYNINEREKVSLEYNINGEEEIQNVRRSTRLMILNKKISFGQELKLNEKKKKIHVKRGRKKRKTNKRNISHPIKKNNPKSHSQGSRNIIPNVSFNRSQGNNDITASVSFNHSQGSNDMTPNVNFNHPQGSRNITPNVSFNHSQRSSYIMPNISFNHSRGSRNMIPNVNFNHSQGSRSIAPNVSFNHSQGSHNITPNVSFNHYQGSRNVAPVSFNHSQGSSDVTANVSFNHSQGGNDITPNVDVQEIFLTTLEEEAMKRGFNRQELLNRQQEITEKFKKCVKDFLHKEIKELSTPVVFDGLKKERGKVKNFKDFQKSFMLVSPFIKNVGIESLCFGPKRGNW